MPSETYGSSSFGSLYFEEKSWGRSPRDSAGELRLQANSLSHTRVLATRASAADVLYGNPSGNYAFQRRLYHKTDFALAYNKALAKARSRVWGDVQASLAVDILEGRETAKMLSDKARDLANAALRARRGDWGGVAKVLGVNKPKGFNKHEDFASRWLAFRYGWTPLVNSIWDMCKVLDSAIPKGSIFATGRASEVREFVNQNAGSARRYDSTVTFHATVKVKVDVRDPYVARLKQLGLTNPLSWAWEVITLSFVVDWFVGVGAYLDGFDAMTGLDCTEYNETLGIIESGKQYFSSPIAGYPAGTILRTYEAKHKSRSLTAKFPLPKFTWGTGINALRAADSLALAANLLKGKR